ncbi:hypothetical protein AXF42_Ash006970 [Apostasia shenzhenica]|uniref:OTU domain-containing protein n=1 Tax=Apostasia shenzhenica TaxID=1088818 RepID=A0A2I0BEN9_9ASPA|nr:hypothetical protein AXF42_Ash006970 [Apostasia shenzhenica]
MVRTWLPRKATVGTGALRRKTINQLRKRCTALAFAGRPHVQFFEEVSGRHRHLHFGTSRVTVAVFTLPQRLWCSPKLRSTLSNSGATMARVKGEGCWQSINGDGTSKISGTSEEHGNDTTIGSILAEENHKAHSLGKRLAHLDSIPLTPRVNGEIPDVDNAMLDHERLSERLAAYGLAELQVEGDGNCQFSAKICLLTSFRDSCLIEILPKDKDPLKELWLSFWSEVHYNSLYGNDGLALTSSTAPTSEAMISFSFFQNEQIASQELLSYILPSAFAFSRVAAFTCNSSLLGSQKTMNSGFKLQ